MKRNCHISVIFSACYLKLFQLTIEAPQALLTGTKLKYFEWYFLQKPYFTVGCKPG